MSPPNPSLAELALVLGEDNVRTLVRTYLRDFPKSFQELGRGERHNRHRLVHSMKSNSRLMGAQSLSRRMAEIEARLSADAASDVTPHDLERIVEDFESAATSLRAFVGESA